MFISRFLSHSSTHSQRRNCSRGVFNARTNERPDVRTHARTEIRTAFVDANRDCVFFGDSCSYSLYYYTPVSHVRSVRSLMRKCARSDQPAYAQGKAGRLYNSDRQRERQGFSFSSTTAQNLETLTLHKSACGCACRIPSQETYAQNQKGMRAPAQNSRAQ